MHQVGADDDIVAQLRVDDAALWVIAASASMRRLSPNAIGGTTSRTLVVVENPEQVVAQALAAGAKKVSAVEDVAHRCLPGKQRPAVSAAARSGTPFSCGRSQKCRRESMSNGHTRPAPPKRSYSRSRRPWALFAL